jgi:hypothetical protein
VMTIGVFVPVSAVFPGTQADMATFVRLIGTLSRTDVLFWCARMNQVLGSASGLSHMERQAFGIRQFLMPDEARLIARFVEEHGGGATVFFRGSLLEIVRWAVLLCEDHSADGTTFENPEVRRTFARVALIASDIWGSRVYGRSLSLDNGVITARERSIGPFRKGVEGGLVAPDLANSLGRGWQIFHELLPSIDPSFGDRFNSATGLTTEEYYLCWCALITNFTKPGSEAAIFDAKTLGSSTRDPNLVQRFVALESQTLVELRQALWGGGLANDVLAQTLPPYDYKPIRERPVLRAADGRAIIIDPIFMMDRVAVGPLFHVLKICGDRQVNQLFAAFGDAFERYVHGVLRRAFPKPGADLFDPLTCGLHGRCNTGEQFQLDACLNYVTDLILFEVKGTWLRDAELAPENSSGLLQSLHRQYGFSDGRAKGTAQLARVVNAIANCDWLGPADEFRQVNRIVPVLVVHDVLLGTPGFGAFVASEFDRALGPHEQLAPGERLKGRVRVLVPIVMTVEDLELLEVSLEHFSLRDALVDYSDSCQDRMTPFRDFLAESPKYSHQIYASRHLASAAMEPLEIAMDRLFSRSADPNP